jgi:hypothetical protein
VACRIRINFPDPVNPESAPIGDNYRTFRLTLRSVLTPVLDLVGTVPELWTHIHLTLDTDQYSVAKCHNPEKIS